MTIRTSWGVTELDTLTGGPYRLTMLAHEPGAGGHTLAWQAIRASAQAGAKVLVFNTELAPESVPSSVRVMNKRASINAIREMVLAEKPDLVVVDSLAHVVEATTLQETFAVVHDDRGLGEELQAAVDVLLKRDGVTVTLTPLGEAQEIGVPFPLVHLRTGNRTVREFGAEAVLKLAHEVISRHPYYIGQTMADVSNGLSELVRAGTTVLAVERARADGEIHPDYEYQHVCDAFVSLCNHADGVKIADVRKNRRGHVGRVDLRCAGSNLTAV